METHRLMEIEIEADYRHCLEEHHKRNDHHPEHFEMPLEYRMQLICDLLGKMITNYKQILEEQCRRNDETQFEMPFECRMQLTCDLLGKAMSMGRGNDKIMDIAQCRAYIEKHDWPGWKHAVKDKLPPASEQVPELEERPGNECYPIQELAAINDETTWINKLECVRDYVNDLLNHKIAVLRVWREIVEKYDPRFVTIEERIQDHDLDKFRPDMIGAFAKRVGRFSGHLESPKLCV